LYTRKTQDLYWLLASSRDSGVRFQRHSINIGMDGVGQIRVRIVGHLQFAYRVRGSTLNLTQIRSTKITKRLLRTTTNYKLILYRNARLVSAWRNNG